MIWLLLKLAAVAAAALYIGGSIKGKLKLALLGAALLGIQFAIISLLLLRSRAYLLGGAFGIASAGVLWEVLRPSRAKSE